MLIMTQNNYNFEGAIFRNSISGFRVRKKKKRENHTNKEDFRII